MAEPKSIQVLKNKHPQSDIYVIGSGPSLDFIDQSFYHNKIVICVNHTINHIDRASPLYIIAKEPGQEMQDNAKSKNANIIMCKRHSGLPKSPLNKIFHPDRTFIFLPKQGALKNIRPNELERSSSTLVSGIHLAAHMGAKNVILIGHDCGTLDGRIHVVGYNKKTAVTKGNAYMKWMRHAKVEKKTMNAKELIKTVYGANLYSLNPFINFGLENHKYKRFDV